MERRGASSSMAKVQLLLKAFMDILCWVPMLCSSVCSAAPPHVTTNAHSFFFLLYKTETGKTAGTRRMGKITVLSKSTIVDPWCYWDISLDFPQHIMCTFLQGKTQTKRRDIRIVAYWDINFILLVLAAFIK